VGSWYIFIMDSSKECFNDLLSGHKIQNLRLNTNI